MKVHLEYGKAGLDVEVPGEHVDVLRPRFVEGLPDEAAAFRDAVREPIHSAPLRELIGSGDRVVVVIPDITRPFPSDRILPWLFEELAQVSAGNITIINGTGSHRANTPAEIEQMVGRQVAGRYRVVNHNAYDADTFAEAGRCPDGRTVLMNREYVEADRRIVLGFIEPHFFAGFSGGYKAVFPGVADIDSIMHYHRASVIGDPRSTWGVLAGNPTQEQIRACGSLLPVDFCINVSLNRERRITGLFCGDVLTAHEQGCSFVKSTVMIQCERAYPTVITTNGGYPLDQNLYQTVKGMSAADQIVVDGGLIIAASQCSDGFPEHGNFRKLLFESDTPEAMLARVLAPGFSMFDQWEAQKLGMILARAGVALYSDIPGEEVTRAHMIPVRDLQGFLSARARIVGDAPVAVLPEGPMTVPYVGMVND